VVPDRAVEQPPAPDRVPELTGDRADDAILAAAVQARVDVLVTGDRRHLLPLGKYCGVRILTPQAFLAELR
jgi:predicted nucleic acid-binding protein